MLLGSVSEPDAIRVLLIKDDAIDRGFLANELSKQGFAVQTVASLAGAPDAVGNADVIVFHCDWTKVSSIDLLDILQRHAADVPIVLLTGEASPAREGLALDKGAIDVIGQSRSSEVLARRLKDVVKAFGRTDQPQAGGMTCGKLLLRPDIGRAYWKDADLGLTLGEYNIVYLLASNVGRYVTYRAIYDRLHYEGFIAGERCRRLSGQCAVRHQAYPEQVPQPRPHLRRDRELQRLRVLLEEARLNRLVARPGAQRSRPAGVRTLLAAKAGI